MDASNPDRGKVYLLVREKSNTRLKWLKLVVSTSQTAQNITLLSEIDSNV